MIPDQSCGNCFFARDGEAAQECRINPPSVVSDDAGPWSAWPIVTPTDWCGCWQPLPDLSPLPDLPEPEPQADDLDTYD